METNVTGSIKLRKLTEKSILGFGKFSERTVGQMIQFKGSRGYLRWAYFNLSKISFIDDVLDSLHIDESLRISKPGIDEIMWKKMQKKMQAFWDDSPHTLSKFIQEQARTKRMKRSSISKIAKQTKSKMENRMEQLHQLPKEF